MEKRWTIYQKRYEILRGNLKEVIEDTIEAVNREIAKNKGTSVSMGSIYMYPIIEAISFFEDEEEGFRTLYFIGGNKTIFTLDLEDFDKLILDFDIEEELNTGEKIHHGLFLTGVNKDEI